MTLNQWALRWSVRPEALAELHLALGLDFDPTAAYQADREPKTEGDVSKLAQLTATKQGGRLWRNNVGAGTVAESGSFLRWGLCNESEAMNRVIKSADLVGIRPTIVTPEMVGALIGQFWAREVKAPGWRYTGTEREQAQARYIGLVCKLGGDARFWNGSGEL